MPDVDPAPFYTKPLKNGKCLEYKWSPINEKYQETKVTTTATATLDFTNTYSAQATTSVNVTDQQVCTGYKLEIRYEGPVMIGERLIIAEKLPNYWADPKILGESERQTGISTKNGACVPSFSTWKIQLCALCTCLTCFCICTETCCKSCHTDTFIQARKDEFYDKVQDLANVAMSKAIASCMEKADERVTERIAVALAQYPLAANQNFVGAGGNPPSPGFMPQYQGQYQGQQQAFAVPASQPLAYRPPVV